MKQHNTKKLLRCLDLNSIGEPRAQKALKKVNANWKSQHRQNT